MPYSLHDLEKKDLSYDATRYNATKSVRVTWPNFHDRWLPHITPDRIKGVTGPTLVQLKALKQRLNSDGVETGSLNTIMETQANYEKVAQASQQQRTIIESQRAIGEEHAEQHGVADMINQGARTVPSQQAAASLIGWRRDELLQMELHKMRQKAEVAWRKEEQITSREIAKEAQITAREIAKEEQATARVSEMEETKRTQALQLTAQKQIELDMLRLQKSHNAGGGRRRSTSEPPSKRLHIAPRPRAGENALQSEAECTHDFFIAWLHSKVPQMMSEYVSIDTILAKYTEDQANPFCGFLPDHLTKQKKWMRDKMTEVVGAGLVEKHMIQSKLAYTFITE